jgi:hypothetical protein
MPPTGWKTVPEITWEYRKTQADVDRAITALGLSAKIDASGDRRFRYYDAEDIRKILDWLARNT